MAWPAQVGPPRAGCTVGAAALAAPAAQIMNRIAQTGKWPAQYQTEWGVPLEKVKNAKDESEVRLISCTNKMNIVFEKQVVKWLMDQSQISGVGNIYKSESLFLAGISPLRKMESLSPQELEKLYLLEVCLQ